MRRFGCEDLGKYGVPRETERKGRNGGIDLTFGRHADITMDKNILLPKFDFSHDFFIFSSSKVTMPIVHSKL